MPRRKHSAHHGLGHGDHLRRHIAGAAARLMAEDGIADYGLAKRKAARQLGASTTDGLPSNEEVEEALRAYQSLYQEEEHPERLRQLRQSALDIMDLLRDFEPCLTGAVLDGTAGRHAAIELDLFADSSKDVEIMLLSTQIPYRIDDIPRRGGEGPETRLQLDWNGQAVRLLIYPMIAKRVQPRNTHHGGHRLRADAADVARLLLAPN